MGVTRDLCAKSNVSGALSASIIPSREGIVVQTRRADEHWNLMDMIVVESGEEFSALLAALGFGWGEVAEVSLHEAAKSICCKNRRAFRRAR